MLLYYFTLAYRTLRKHATFTMINAVGLSFGMTAFVLIMQYVVFESSFNNFHENLPTLYRVVNQKNGEYNIHTAPGFAPAAASRISGVDQYCRLAEGINLGTGVVRCDDVAGGVDRSFRENNFVYADGNFFEFFTFPIAAGSVAPLKDPNTVALSRRTSYRYFGEDSALGRILTLNNQFGTTAYTVVLVYEDMPQNSDLQYDLVFSIQTLYNQANLNGNEGWASMDGTGSEWLLTFLNLKPGTDPERVSKHYTQLQKEIKPVDASTVILQAVSAMRLGLGLSDPMPTFGNLRFVYILSGIAALIMVIAWFNYINLSTASALKRAKEVGIRKVTGASKVQLVKQFMGESAMLYAVAFVLCTLFVSLLKEPYNMIIGKDISFDIINHNFFWSIAVLVFVVGTVASGSYTAFVLSSFNPSRVLKGAFTKSANGVFLRKSLVVFQFSISFLLIASTIILFQQWKYMGDRPLGLQAEQLLVIREAEIKDDDTFTQRSKAFGDQLRSMSFVYDYCRSGNVPTEGFNFSTSGITRQQPAPGEDKINYDVLTVDNQFFDTYSIPMAAGDNFTSEMCGKAWNDLADVILNEKACEELGFASSAAAIGQKIIWDKREFIVRGVARNYHHLSVQYAIGPILFVPSNNGGYYTVKLETRQISSQLADLEALYKRNFPGNPFEFEFVDDMFDAQYRSEKQYGIIFTIASCLAIFIGCLGLFGLAAYSVEQRTKEIGIRKALGSTTAQIVTLFSNDYLGLMGFAFIVAIPVSWWSMQQWLQGFAYHVTISGWVFAIAGLVTSLLAWITVGIQALKGAVSNPVKSLRSE